MTISLRLKIHKDGQLVGTQAFDRDLIKVGRLASAHLTLDDEKASRIHLVINAESIDKLSVVDMGSVEGTFLNGKRVSKAPLKFGDEIRIGSTTLTVEDGTVPPEVGETAAAAALAQAPSGAEDDGQARTEVVQLAELTGGEAQAPQPAAPSAESGLTAVGGGLDALEQSATLAAILANASNEGTQEAAAAPAASAMVPAGESAAPAPAPAPAAAAISEAPVQAAPAPASEPPAASAAEGTSGTWKRPTQFGTYVQRPITPRRPLIRQGQLGLCVRYYWGDALLESYQVDRGNVFVGYDCEPSAGLVSRWFAKKKIGAKNFCQFNFESALLDGNRRHLLAHGTDGGFALNLTRAMTGGIHRDNGTVETLAAGSSAMLKPVDFAWINVGGIRVEMSFERQPKPIVVPWYVGLDVRLVSFFFALVFLVGAFVINASTYTEADIIADDIGEKELKLVKAFIKEAEKPKPNKLLEKYNKQEKKAEPQGGEMAERHKGQEGKMGRKDMAPNKNKRSAPKAIDINAKDLVKHSGGLVSVLGGGGGGGGLATIFGQGGLGGDIKGAIGNMHGPQVGDAGGFGGLGLRGTGSGGGGSGNTIGIGGIGTKGVGGGLGGYGANVGGLGSKKKSDVVISDGESTIQGALDKELIRQVIQRNMGQIRYCYEKELVRKPDLAGKVVIRFKISGSGQVPEAKVHAGTTLKDVALSDCIISRVRNWRFPEPKGGGNVIVTYPFVFKPAGD